MNAKFLSAAVLVSGLMASSLASAVTTIDFNAVALRGENAAGHAKATITEYANGNGASIVDSLAGQKSYYGTSYFDGARMDTLSSITFTYKPTAGASPYMNFAITNGSTSGVLTIGFGDAPALVDNLNGSFTATYNFASVHWRLVEIAGAASGFADNNNLTFAQVASWTMVTGDRTMAAAETSAFGDPKGPVSDGLAIMWGDTAANYLGQADIFDVTVTGADRQVFEAGNVVPEPASLALVGVALLGMAASRRRR